MGAERRAALLDRAGRRRRRRADASAARLSGQDLARRQAHRVPHEQLVGRGAPQLSRRPEPPDLDRRSEDASSSSRRRGPIPRTWIRSGSATSSTSSPIATASPTSGRTTRSRRSSTQVTKFTDFDVKTLDSGAGAVVFEQAGYIHELDPKTGQEHIVTITADGRFPVDDAAVEGRDQPHDATSRSRPPASASRSKRAARSSPFPPKRATSATSRNSSGSAERDPAWSPDGKYISYFSDQSGEYKLIIESQDGLAPPREIALPNPTHYYTPSWSPDSKKLLYTDTNLKVWVIDVASGTGEDRRQRSVDGARAHAESGVESRIRSGSPTPAGCSRCTTRSSSQRGDRARRKQVTDGLADSRLAGVGCERQVSLVPRVDGLRAEIAVARHDVLRSRRKLRAVPGGAEEERAEPAAAGERRGNGVGSAARPRRGQARGRRAAGQPRAAATPRDARALRDRADRFRRSAAAHHRRPRRPERQYSQLRAGAAGTVYFLEAVPARRGARGAGRQHAASLPLERSPRRAVSSPASPTYDVSADGHKLVYRAAAARCGTRRGAPRGGAPQLPALFLVDADRRLRPRRAGPPERRAPHVSRSEGGVQADLLRRLAQPARLPLREEHARRRLAEDEGDVRRSCCRTSITART